MAWKSVLALAAVGHALRTGSTVSELQALAEANLALETEYLRVLQAGADRPKPLAEDTDHSHLFQPYGLLVPIDHFHNDSIYEPHTNDTFPLRFWFDATHYQPGGPVIVLQSGETSGVDRLPFLQTGIVNILTKATGGLGVILEHRYYGESIPVANLSTENMRFLTTDQAMADMAYFAQNVRFDGLEDHDLTAPNVPYIAYGGSYAGALVAILRKAYPDVYWGAISSSGVTEAIYDYWEYYTAAQLFAPGDCANITGKITNVIDRILIGKNGTEYVQKLKDLFGLGHITRSNDFADAATVGGLEHLQETHWNPALNSDQYGEYCDLLQNSNIVHKAPKDKRHDAVEILKAAGYEDDVDTLITPLLNHIGWINGTVVSSCKRETQDECFTHFNETFYQQDDVTQSWRSWNYQVCFEWGYLQTGSGVPEDQLPLPSRLVDIEFLSAVCRDAFNITEPSRVERINKWGGFHISYPRLAIVDGEHDPWRQATPHAIGLPPRPDTLEEPYLLIPAGVHHWDEYGLLPNETTDELPPQSIQVIQSKEALFVVDWLKEWKLAKGKTPHRFATIESELEL